MDEGRFEITARQSELALLNEFYPSLDVLLRIQRMTGDTTQGTAENKDPADSPIHMISLSQALRYAHTINALFPLARTAKRRYAN